MKAKPGYSFKATVKSDVSDELINTYLLRPIAGLIVRILYHTPVTPNQVTIASTIAGAIAAYLYVKKSPAAIAAAGLCVTLKDLLDSADGQLARAKQMYSRIGRFLDSIGDFVVNLLVFTAITAALYSSNGNPWLFLLGLTAFLGISLRVSFHVFYQTSFLHQEGVYSVNRTTEEVRPEDRAGDRRALALQQIFQFLYGWQDALMVRLDRWSRKGVAPETDQLRRWYTDETGLRISGFLGIGTELFVLMLFSVANRMEWYLIANVAGMNLLWVAAVLYRKVILTRRLRK